MLVSLDLRIQFSTKKRTGGYFMTLLCDALYFCALFPRLWFCLLAVVSCYQVKTIVFSSYQSITVSLFQVVHYDYGTSLPFSWVRFFCFFLALNLLKEDLGLRETWYMFNFAVDYIYIKFCFVLNKSCYCIASNNDLRKMICTPSTQLKVNLYWLKWMLSPRVFQPCNCLEKIQIFWRLDIR